MALKNLSSLSRTDYHSFLDSFDTVLTDCDGKLIFYFLTNSSLYTGSVVIVQKIYFEFSVELSWVLG